MSHGTDAIVIRGAAEHNLKGIDLEIPHGTLTVFTGVSGSGKSSLAFDTLCREGQRRFLESLSAYARQFLGQMERARVESLSGLSPTIAIHQKTIHRNPRSTVGTVTEIYDHYRLLFARLGTPHCVRCGRVIETQTTDRITDRIVAMPEGTRIEILAPIVRGRKGEYRKELAELARNGFLRARIDGEIRRLDEEITLDRYRNHTIEIVIDRIVVRPGERSRIAEGVEQAAALGADGNIVLLAPEGEETISTRFACPTCGIGLPELEPRLFSFNAPQGACPTCKGIGELRTFDPDLIVPDPERSIAEGAIVTMTKDGRVLYNRWGIDDWRQAGEQLGFSIDRPWKDLSEAHRRLLLYGDPETIVEIRWKHQRGTRRVEGHDRRPLPGVIPMLERAYHFSAARHLERYMNLVTCPDCEGSRLRPESLAVTFRGRTIAQLSRLTVQEARAFFAHLEKGAAEEQIGGEIFREIENRLRFLDDVGLGYLTIDRRVGTLSGGESQRIRLAGQIGSGLRGVLYVLDEPSIGLHPRDNARLLATLTTLRDQGNTVVVVEHDEATMRAADFLVDIGPGAGREGGELVAAGTLAAIERASASRTGAFLRGDAAIPVPERRRTGNGKVLRIEGAEHFNLKGIDVEIPLGVFTCVTGVSGSGKSTLIHEILHKALARVLHGAKAIPGKHRRIVGIEAIDKVIEIDQSPIGRTPRSNPATYTGLLDPIRELMAMLPRSRARGYKKGRFSFNVRGGRCEACEGAGVKTIDMQFLAPVEVLCEVCEGTRFNRETLEVTYKGKHIADILAMSVEEAYRFFEAHPKVRRILECLSDIGLGYLTLGQPSTTLSGGEAQRIKLVTELCRPATGRTLYLLDEPSTGLHPADIERLLHALDRLVEAGNSVVVIEHNLDIIKVADHIVDLGPGSGAAGGEVVFAGTPEALVADGRSPLAPFLAEALAPPRRKPSRGRRRRRGKGGRGEAIEIVKASKNNLKEIDVTIPHRTLTVITGVSGSGKSSLAFDTIFAEGQRRYVESLSTYARRFLGRLDRAPVVSVRGLAPAIAIDQKHLAHNPRSTVATTTEIYDYLRLLYAYVGVAHCPDCGIALRGFDPTRAAEDLCATFDGERIHLLAPLPPELPDPVSFLLREGFIRLSVDGQIVRIDEEGGEIPAGARAVFVVIDRVVVTPQKRGRLADSFATAFRIGRGMVRVESASGREKTYRTETACPGCGFEQREKISPRHFSFNSHQGACPRCAGLGVTRRIDEARLFPHPERPLRQAMHPILAVAFWRKGSHYAPILEEVARVHGISLSTPFGALSETTRRILLHGTGSQRYAIETKRRKGGRSRTYAFEAQWAGILEIVASWERAAQGPWWVAKLSEVFTSGVCPECRGGRLKRELLAVRVGDLGIDAFCRLSVRDALAFLEGLVLTERERTIAGQILRELTARLGFLCDVGLGYLTLDRRAGTLSGGEAQRIRLATQIGSRLNGVLYVLDEPTIGLHPRDTERLLGTLTELRDLGNTVIVVEHDPETIRRADHVIDMGEGAGEHGGQIVAEGPVTEILRAERSLTGAYLSGRKEIPLPARRRTGNGSFLRVLGAAAHNLKGIDVAFPLGTFTVVTGVSGSGKSTLVFEIVEKALRKARRRGDTEPGRHRGIEGAEAIDGVVVIDQSPIGRTPKSNPATYTKVLDPIRSLFARLPEARKRGYKPGRFSFNVRGGRCETCEGMGALKIEMHFLSDVWITCDDCKGRRFNRETLDIRYRGFSIADILEMEVSRALERFANHRRIVRILSVLDEVGLGYLRLGQAATTLSGGEAQRLKLAAELARPGRGHTLYLLDEPTVGLHFADVERLVRILHRLVDAGNSVVVIEHNLDVIKVADHVIDLGPEGGEGGGEVVFTGTPEELATHPTSHTARFLAPLLPRPADAA